MDLPINTMLPANPVDTLSMDYLDRSPRSALPDIMPGETKIPCHLCDKTFTRRSDLKRHILNIHEGIKPFRCDLCQTTFSQITNLRGHYLKQHGRELQKVSPMPKGAILYVR